jgi:hypothetical protein
MEFNECQKCGKTLITDSERKSGLCTHCADKKRSKFHHVVKVIGKGGLALLGVVLFIVRRK